MASEPEYQAMLFAELEYTQPYADVHEGIASLLRSRFSRVESGLQGDSWIWVLDDGQKVAVDTFDSMRHQVKSPGPSPLVQQVLEALATGYRLRILATPRPEAHEVPGPA